MSKYVLYMPKTHGFVSSIQKLLSIPSYNNWYLAQKNESAVQMNVCGGSAPSVSTNKFF